ncbi:MAG: metal ABC transporter substrate-binding protein [Alphaproteobacteria bacterium]|nr:metal ABC transporter substrate-binding protein [Alphaproteobacteria bacterium]
MILRRSFLVLAASLFFAGTLPAQAEDKLPVVASFSILGDLVQEVGGEKVQITTLVGPDGDAHVYEPSPADAKAIVGAKLVFINGLQFEGWIDRLIDASGTKANIITVSKAVKPHTFEEEGMEDDHGAHGEHGDHEAHDHDHGAFDPHAWQDIANGKLYVEAILAALVDADPANAAYYKGRATAYLEALSQLDARIKSQFAAIPAERRRVVTSHDAFGYFAAAYGITFIAPQGVSTESEASAAEVAGLIDQIRKERISAVFVENITNPALITQIAQESGARVGGTLYSDALSTEAGPAPTYIKMFEHNAAQLAAAMTGS